MSRTAQIADAADWLLQSRVDARPIIPQLKTRFRLSTAEAVEAIRAANAARAVRFQTNPSNKEKTNDVRDKVQAGSA